MSFTVDPSDPCCMPTQGSELSTSNFLLRVRRTKFPSDKLETKIIGVVDRTIRFASLLDYQMDFHKIGNYTEPLKMFTDTADEYLKVLGADESLPEESVENNTDELDLSMLCARFTKPIPYDYSFKSKACILYQFDEKTGNIKFRNTRAKSKKFAVIQISYTKNVKLPINPIPTTVDYDPSSPKSLEKILDEFPEQYSEAEKECLKKLQYLFSTPEEGSLLHSYSCRPIWLPNTLLCFFPEEEVQMVTSLLPAVSYYFSSGPWRKSVVRLGYDPRKDNRSRL